MKIAFLHPDLGIGGAERAVLDAALALKEEHDVMFYTAHHDPSHCFEETKDGTFCVKVAGDWLPRSTFGRFYALWAYIRMMYTALYLVLMDWNEYDIVFCDQISACIPILRLRTVKILFYCHFPDMLLTTRKSFLKKMYRKPIDWLEEKTTGQADVILVNSHFTATVFHKTFLSLAHVKPEVLYPVPDFSKLDVPLGESDLLDDVIPSSKHFVFLSINRYEKKKDIPLAIKSFAKLYVGKDTENIHLVVAGGYDERVTENVTHYRELRQLASNLDVLEKTSFLRSISDAQKTALLRRADCLLYTPDNEHFGIVPVEAMYMRCPVIAVRSGGPKETVAHDVTGILCEPTEEAFSAAMGRLLTGRPGLGRQMGEAGRARVDTLFSRTASCQQLLDVVSNLANDR